MPDEFWRVTLHEPARRCCDCAAFAYREGKPPTHHRPHRVPGVPTRWPPQDWWVTGEMRGDAVAVGTTLRLVDSLYQTFYEGGGSASLDWLLEAMDGTDRGAIYYVRTSALNDDPDDRGVDLDARGRALWPTGIEPLGGSDARRARHTWEVTAVSSRQPPGRVRMTD